jgi:T3SS EscN ATPase C-terminal domain
MQAQPDLTALLRQDMHERSSIDEARAQLADAIR